MKYIFILITALIFSSGFSLSADARNFVWSDPDLGYSLMFSESWTMNLATGTGDDVERAKFILPGRGDPFCRIAAKRDKRFMIHTVEAYRHILFDEIRWDYWDHVTADMNDRFFYFANDGGLSQGSARYTLLDYSPVSEEERTESKEPVILRRAMIYASIYGDLHMVIHCDAPQASFNKHLPAFNQLLSMVHFVPQYTVQKTGWYRNFLNDGDTSVHRYKPGSFDSLTRQEPEKIEYERKYRSHP